MPYIKSHHQQQSHKLRQLIPAATTTTEKEEEELGIPLVVVVVLVPLFIFDGFQGLETGWETKGNPYRGKNSVWSQKLWGRLPRLRLSSLRQKKMDVWATLRKLWQNKLFGLEPMILQPIRLASHASLGLLLNANPCPSTSSLCWGQGWLTFGCRRIVKCATESSLHTASMLSSKMSRSSYQKLSPRSSSSRLEPIKHYTHILNLLHVSYMYQIMILLDTLIIRRSIQVFKNLTKVQYIIRDIEAFSFDEQKMEIVLIIDDFSENDNIIPIMFKKYVHNLDHRNVIMHT